MEPYIPRSLPLETIDWVHHIKLISEANRALARYDGLLTGIVHPEILLSPLTIREAVLSSRIEGTQASLEEVLQFEADAEMPFGMEKQRDIQEIINYRKAMISAVEYLQERPLSINMIRDLHRTLLTSVRGRDREPGEIRRIQNYIAPPGTPMERATFIPPAPPLIMDALSNWEIYLHKDERDPLVQLAVLKAQFELIHPFRDGNGRIGRMLAPLILYSKKVLSRPMFYISAYLENHREEYYARLLGISQQDDWDGWISFFLRALAEQADENTRKSLAIQSLYGETSQTVVDLTRSQYALKAVDAMFMRPVFKTADFITESQIPNKTAHRILQDLREHGVLVLMREGKGKRPAIYAFPQLIAITEGTAP